MYFKYDEPIEVNPEHLKKGQVYREIDGTENVVISVGYVGTQRELRFRLVGSTQVKSRPMTSKSTFTVIGEE